ncbi:MAG TPA: M15 family metallopeptidase [Acetivibrio sp.]|nr:M15 family metallopeptidase [Acetivibrio sp.]
MYKGKNALRRKRRLMFARIRTLVILVLAVWGVISFFQNSGEPKNEDKPVGSHIDAVEDLNSINVGAYGQDINTDMEGYGYVPKTNSQNSESGFENSATGNEGTDNQTSETVYIDDWRLILVNADNPLPDDYTFELSSLDETRKFDSRAIDELKMLVERCRRETGGSIWAQSTYRDRNSQKTVFEQKVREYINSGKSREEAEELTATSISRPGTSEHETGLAVDFNYAKTSFENTSVFKWLMEHAHEYGFILRYPDGKQSITKVKYEPWHFRYVGKEHAQVIKSKEFCLEEYIDYLKSRE